MIKQLRSFDVSRAVWTAVTAFALGCSPSALDPGDPDCGSLGPDDLIITEFMADPGGADTGKQYIEIYNATDEPIDLSRVTLFQSMADGSRLNSAGLLGATIAPRGYFVLGDTGNQKDTRPNYIDFGYGSGLGSLRHENGRIGLACAGRVLNEIKYSSPVTPGHARQLASSALSDSVARSNGANWCDAVEPLVIATGSEQNFGSPGQANGNCSTGAPETTGGEMAPTPALSGSGGTASQVPNTQGTCYDATLGIRRSPREPQSSELLINEVMAAPSSGNNGTGEWFELLATRDTDLNGVELINESGDRTTLASDTCLDVKAGGTLLLARSGDSSKSGGLPVPFALYDFTLADAATNTVTERSLTISLHNQSLDRLTWTRSTKGASWQRSATTANALGISSAWCNTPPGYPYGTGDIGTPGAANAPCATSAATTSGGTGSGGEWPVGNTAAVSGGTGSSLSSTVAIAASGAGGSSSTWRTTSEAAQSMGGTRSAPTSSGGTGSAPTSSGGTRSAPTSSGGTESLGGVPSTESAAGGIANGGTLNSSATGGGNLGAYCRDSEVGLRAKRAPVIGDLEITEVMAAPSVNNNAEAEWFEVKANTAVDLNGLLLTNESTRVTSVESEACVAATPGERLIFARSVDPAQNGGLPYVTWTFAFTLADSSSSTHAERSVTLSFEGVEMSRATWSKSLKGASWQLSEGVAGEDAGTLGRDAGGSISGALWCAAPPTLKFGAGDRGTPGEQNVACP